MPENSASDFPDNSELMKLEAELIKAWGDHSSCLRESMHEVQQPQLGKYVVQEVLGESGQAFVVRAFDPDLERSIVLKIYRTDLPAGQKERLIQEGRALSSLQSKYVVKCFAVEEIEGHLALVLEFVEGKTLAESRTRLVGDNERIREVMLEVAYGIQAVHGVGLLHGDIKPQNVILTPEGNVRLIDFGLSQPISRSQPFQFSGSPGYLPPERIDQSIGRIDRRSDIFGIGAVLCFLLTGKPPFDAETREQSLELSRQGKICFQQEASTSGLAEICRQALATSPVERQANVAELIAQLKSHPTESPLLEGIARDNTKRVLAIAALALLVGAVLLTTFLRGKDSAEDSSDQQASFRNADEAEILENDLVDRFGTLQGVTEIPYEFAVLRLHEDKFLPIEANDEGVLQFDIGQEVYLYVNPKSSAWLSLFSFEIHGQGYQSDVIFPREPRDFLPLSPLDDDAGQLIVTDVLDADGEPQIRNLVRIVCNTAPGMEEYLYLMITNKEVQKPERYLRLTEGKSVTRDASQNAQRFGALMRGVERVRNHKISDRAIRYFVSPKEEQSNPTESGKQSGYE